MPDRFRGNYDSGPRAFPDDDVRRLADHLRMPVGERLVGDAMRPGILACRAGTMLPEVARLMAARRVHCVIVRGPAIPPARAGGWALLSDMDLACALAGGAFDTATAGEVASVPMVTVSPDATLGDAARLMHEHATAHLVVTGRGTGAPVGVLSTLDLAAALAGLASPSLLRAAR